MGSIPGLGRSSGEGKGYLLQYSGLENVTPIQSMGSQRSQTRLSHFHFILQMRKLRQNNFPKIIQLVGGEPGFEGRQCECSILAPNHGPSLPTGGGWWSELHRSEAEFRFKQCGLPWLIRELPKGCRHRKEAHGWYLHPWFYWKEKGLTTSVLSEPCLSQSLQIFTPRFL